MYREDVLKPLKEGISFKENMEILYTANVGLFVEMGTGFGFTDIPVDELLQIAYLALDNAVKVYTFESKYSFLSFFRKCFFHECYVFRLENNYTFKLNQYSYKVFKESDLEVLDCSSVCLAQLDKNFDSIESNLISEILWGIVDEQLTPKNSYILHERFKKNKTFKEIASILGIGSERVRVREISSLKRLRNNKDVQQLAKDVQLIR